MSKVKGQRSRSKIHKNVPFLGQFWLWKLILCPIRTRGVKWGTFTEFLTNHSQAVGWFGRNSEIFFPFFFLYCHDEELPWPYNWCKNSPRCLGIGCFLRKNRHLSMQLINNALLSQVYVKCIRQHLFIQHALVHSVVCL